MQPPDQPIPVPMPPLLHIVLHEPEFVVIDKPSGLLSVPGKGEANQDCVPARIRVMFPHATGPLVVHRLDMDTSGLLVVALTPRAQRELSMQFERGQVGKAYTALVEGDVPRDEGTIDLPIRTDIDNRPMQIVDHLHGKPSRTHYRVLSREVDRTRLRLTPLTGRTHQLRVHCAAPRPQGLGCPILGDVLYGSGPASAPRLCLHACELAFTDPTTGRRVDLHIPVPF